MADMENLGKLKEVKPQNCTHKDIHCSLCYPTQPRIEYAGLAAINPILAKNIELERQLAEAKARIKELDAQTLQAVDSSK